MHYRLSSKQFSVHEYKKYLNFGNVERCMSSEIFEAAETATNSTYLTVWLPRRFLSDCLTATPWLPIITKSIKLRARVRGGFQLVDNFHSFIHSGHFYSAPSSPLLLRGAHDYSTDTGSEFHAKAHRQLQVKDLPKDPTWWLERESNPRPSGWKSSTQPRRHHIPIIVWTPAF